MSARSVGIILLLVASEALGLVFGEWSNRLYRQMVPLVGLSQFNQNAAHIAFILRGAVMGLAIFLFSLIAIFIARFFRTSAQTSTVVVAPSPLDKR